MENREHASLNTIIDIESFLIQDTGPGTYHNFRVVFFTIIKNRSQFIQWAAIKYLNMIK